MTSAQGALIVFTAILPPIVLVASAVFVGVSRAGTVRGLSSIDPQLVRVARALLLIAGIAIPYVAPVRILPGYFVPAYVLASIVVAICVARAPRWIDSSLLACVIAISALIAAGTVTVLYLGITNWPLAKCRTSSLRAASSTRSLLRETSC